ncbi:contactin-like [Gigantopelta aegis]|uniref:contactin-like n=1 Tax=Gigantopelta aegis TaxID=1735272 RepID=UPI001B88CD7D|nr:contactin-like [Gigantopelta aegis]
MTHGRNNFLVPDVYIGVSVSNRDDAWSKQLSGARPQRLRFSRCVSKVTSTNLVNDRSSKMKVVVLSLLILIASGELILDCPDDWQSFEQKCYKFVFFPELQYDAAKAACVYHGAYLVTVGTLNEHTFISNWLLANDLARKYWFTSGLVRNLNEGDLIWESDMAPIPPEKQWWLNDQHRTKEGRHIVYYYGVTSYGWSRSLGTNVRPYICETLLKNAGQIIQEDRDFDYGLDETDPNRVPRGPVIITEPVDMVEIGHAPGLSIECVAFAYPHATYRIYRSSSSGDVTEITPDLDLRFTVTNGKLTIADPREEVDAGRYHCEIENDKGRLLSSTMLLSFGFLNEFSNVIREPVRAKLHYYAIISCDPPNHRPAVAFNWLKGISNNLIRTDINPHIFNSYNGKIYFSEVSITDADQYRCIVKLISGNSVGVGTSQPPSGVSLPIDLQITGSFASDWGPEIGNDFIAVYPSTPKNGDRVRLECLAFGTMPIVYKWSRENLPMPLDSWLEDHNRILFIENLHLEDEGVYTCTASRGTTSHSSKSFHLAVEAKPYFIFPLRNQHADIGRELRWRCEARAKPDAVYSWLKNGLSLAPIVGAIEITGNLLTIKKLNPERDNGMYQCAATNKYGTTYTNAQLRVLAFKPSFSKHPLEVNTMASIGGNTTLLCNPEAAPSPNQFKWFKNGVDMGLNPGDTVSRVRLLRNGNLFISPVAEVDMATYRCEATNEYGTDSSTGRLTVVRNSAISNGPQSQKVRVNETMFLRCEASHHPSVELVYDWLFQNSRVNFKDAHYERGTGLNRGGLYLRHAQFRHSGIYTCVAVSSFDRSTRNATVTVYGPPGEPSGVFVNPAVTTTHSMQLWWTPGQDYGNAVTLYRVEASTNFQPDWRTVAANIPDRDTLVDGRRFRMYVVTRLKAGTAYQFRMRATNFHGVGLPSLASKVYQTPPAPPFLAPENVGGGGGSVGDFSITWTPLNQSDHGGPGIGYHVYWRLHNPSQLDSLFKKERVYGNKGKLVLTLGQDSYYLQHDVIVEAFNNLGPGPNSSVVVVYSAEDLPSGTPAKVYAFPFNATANNVSWEAVPDTREVMKGKIVGYQINYWNLKDVNRTQQFIRYLGQRNNGTVIGLEAFDWYEFDVQVYNSAGLGPRSERYRQEVYGNAPLSYPTEVHIWSHGSDSVRVTWRGISTTVKEEPLIGYVVRYWHSTEDIRTAYDTVVTKTSWAVVRGVTNNTVYKLRVFGYSRGGEGKMSPNRYFTLGGIIVVDPKTTEIIAGAAQLVCSVKHVLLSIGVVFIAVKHNWSVL